jgi:hypothetical protein
VEINHLIFRRVENAQEKHPFQRQWHFTVSHPLFNLAQTLSSDSCASSSLAIAHFFTSERERMRNTSSLCTLREREVFAQGTLEVTS